MTKDDIMKLAREAGLFTHKDVQPEILAFANLVAAHTAEVALAEAYRCGYEAGAAAEREACAAMFDDRNVWEEEVGERIRAREILK